MEGAVERWLAERGAGHVEAVRKERSQRFGTGLQWVGVATLLRGAGEPSAVLPGPLRGRQSGKQLQPVDGLADVEVP